MYKVLFVDDRTLGYHRQPKLWQSCSAHSAIQVPGVRMTRSSALVRQFNPTGGVLREYLQLRRPFQSFFDELHDDIDVRPE
jgi:hypothetical protein